MHGRVHDLAEPLVGEAPGGRAVAGAAFDPGVQDATPGEAGRVALGHRTQLVDDIDLDMPGLDGCEGYG